MVAKMRRLGLEDLCVHQVCLSGQCDFMNSLDVFGKQGIQRTALWSPMIDAYGEAPAKVIWDASGLVAESLCAAELFAGSDNLKRMLERADKFGARTLVVITGGLQLTDGTGLERARERVLPLLAAADELARPFNVRLAFEPLHPMVCGNRSVVSSLEEALSLLRRLDATHQIGLAIDSYALWWEHGLAAKLAAADELILNYHVSDWLSNTGDLRFDRGMPGEGQIDLVHLRHKVEEAGYQGPVEIEIFSQNRWWKKPPESMIKAIIAGMNQFY
jgi:sugar phosphate isomerase/epimerase